MDKFFIWVGRHRGSIGYAVGGGLVLGGILNLVDNNTVIGVCYVLWGLAIVYDTRTYC
jgi:hypothetical protein